MPATRETRTICSATPLHALPGVGTRRAEALGKLGLFTVGELLYHFPRAYQHRGDVRLLADGIEGEASSFVLTVATMPVSARLKAHMTLTKFTAVDEAGTRCTITYFNQPYLQSRFMVGSTFRFYGKLSRKSGKYALSSPTSEPVIAGHTLPEFTALYPLAAGISQKQISSLIAIALGALPDSSPPDRIPAWMREKLGLPSIAQALREVHTPKNQEELTAGRDRFILEEVLTFATGVTLSKRIARQGRAPRFTLSTLDEDAFIAALPYALTGAQQRAIDEMRSDMSGEGTDATSPYCPPMNRLLSGDVGSGKTVCAAAAAYMAICGGWQCALMAPTEILAQQHYHDLSDLFTPFGISCALLTGSTPAAEKRAIRAAIADGTLSFVIGTHALLSQDVSFARLGLVITDEQHRFGVMQRATLVQKTGEVTLNPHVLVMSATPIPRSLALVLYGDLSLSVLDEMPPGRQHIDTCVVDESYRKNIYGFMRRQLREGHQVYIVCPAVEHTQEEEEETQDVIPFDYGYDVEKILAPLPTTKAVVAYAEELQQIFPNDRVAFLHGRMKSSEKERVMASFVANETKILVSTTVIEVGVNVPNATLMIVENADRFGLSQLHQLRGRVGRGKDKSYCVLVSDTQGETARARLEAMRTLDDGYAIAERDLALRGPGDFFPSGNGEAQQHGHSSLATLCTNLEEVQRAFALAEEICARDPALTLPEHAPLRAAVNRLFDLTAATIN